MDVNPRFLIELNAVLAATSPSAQVRVRAAETFEGASPWSNLPVAILTVEAATLPLPIGEVCQRIFERHGVRPEGHTLAQVAASTAALSLTQLIGLDLGAGADEGSGESRCWTESLAAALALQALAFALLAIVEAASGSEDANSQARRMHALLRQTCERWRINPESLLLIRAARARDIPFLPVSDDPSLWQFGWGRRSKLMWEMGSNADGMVGFKLSSNKDAAKRLLRDLGIPTPRWRAVRAGEDPAAAGAGVGWPCVVKPIDRGGGKGITANVRSPGELQQAAALARRFASSILVEAHVPGDDHRLTVIDGRLIAVTRRRAPTVTGDGKSTIAELVAALNRTRLEAPRSGGYLKPVNEDPAMDAALSAQGVSRTSVLPEGTTVRLRTNANHSTGGTLDDLTDQAHPQVKALAEEMALAFGLPTCGIDYMSEDVSRNPLEGGGTFIELNATPGVRGMSAAGFDEAQVAAHAFGETVGRIPVRLFLAPEADQHAIAAAIRREEHGAGLALLGQGTVEGLTLPAPGGNPLRLVQALFRLPSLSSCDIVWTPEALCRFGLPADRLEEVVILGEAPPEPWQSLLQRAADGMSQHEMLEAMVTASSS